MLGAVRVAGVDGVTARLPPGLAAQLDRLARAPHPLKLCSRFA
jgi:hypothetical protein